MFNADPTRNKVTAKKRTGVLGCPGDDNEKNDPKAGDSKRPAVEEEEEELYDFKKNVHAVPLASARQRPQNQKENQAGQSSERTVQGQKKPAVGCLF